MPSPFVENWHTQARKGVLELAVLNALSRGRMYGYEIVKALQRVPGLVIVEGTVYPIMSRLAKEGLVESSLEPSPEGPARKYYRLNADGEAALRRINAAWDEINTGISGLRSPHGGTDGKGAGDSRVVSGRRNPLGRRQA
jgi:PadR family transcriptional regulator PadR